MAAIAAAAGPSRRPQSRTGTWGSALAGDYWQGGGWPFEQTTDVPGGTTIVVLFFGGGGLLLLMQPDIIDAATNTLSRIFITGSS